MGRAGVDGLVATGYERVAERFDERMGESARLLLEALHRAVAT